MTGNREFSLSRRLRTILEMAGNGTAVADIGTDHAYIPIALIQNKSYQFAVASDVNCNALEIARRNIRAHHLEDRICCTLSDGLDQIEQAVDCIVLSGMGGETIANILFRDKHKTLSAKKIIAQPQSKTERFRNRMLTLGLYPVRESILWEDGHFYIIMRLETDPELYERFIRSFGPDMFSLYGLLPMLSAREQVFWDFVSKKISDYEKILSSAPQDQENAPHMAEIKKKLILSKKLVSEGRIV